MNIGCLNSIINESSSKKKKKKKENEYMNTDHMAGAIGGLSLTPLGAPGIGAGYAAGYLGSKAVKKAAHWLDKR
jgi:hypothetical protein